MSVVGASKRRRILKRDRNRCRYCGKSHGVHLTIDHIIPRSRGGSDHECNLVACCPACNARKADRLPSEAGMAIQPRR